MGTLVAFWRAEAKRNDRKRNEARRARGQRIVIYIRSQCGTGEKSKKQQVAKRTLRFIGESCLRRHTR